MLDAAVKARKFTANKGRQDLDTDETLALAVVRLLEIIGEAAAKVTQDLQSRHSGIP